MFKRDMRLISFFRYRQIFIVSVNFEVVNKKEYTKQVLFFPVDMVIQDPHQQICN